MRKFMRVSLPEGYSPIIVDANPVIGYSTVKSGREVYKFLDSLPISTLIELFNLPEFKAKFNRLEESLRQIDRTRD